MLQKVNLANLPTKIVKAEKLSKELGVNLYFKRDDQTGSEISGNKIRKLEYALKEAKDKGCTTVITTGGIQSNHCRATVAAAVMMGLRPIVLLRIKDPAQAHKVEGNFFLNRLFGAEVRFCSPEEYRDSRNEIMASIAKELEKKGEKSYVIPEGASFGIGSAGYYDAMKEIVSQEREIGMVFDTVVVAVGSGGTHSGLVVANCEFNLNKRVLGFAVCDDTEYFVNRIHEINGEFLQLMGKDPNLVPKSAIEINDGYVGIGYAISRPEELEFIKYVAKTEAIVLDPVYTGKAMYGLYNEIKKGNIKSGSNILFIHTGGLFGLFPKQEEFVW